MGYLVLLMKLLSERWVCTCFLLFRFWLFRFIGGTEEGLDFGGNISVVWFWMWHRVLIPWWE